MGEGRGACSSGRGGPGHESWWSARFGVCDWVIPRVSHPIPITGVWLLVSQDRPACLAAPTSLTLFVIGRVSECVQRSAGRERERRLGSEVEHSSVWLSVPRVVCPFAHHPRPAAAAIASPLGALPSAPLGQQQTSCARSAPLQLVLASPPPLACNTPPAYTQTLPYSDV